MKAALCLFALLFSISVSAQTTAFDLEEIKQRCQTHYQDSDVLYSTLYHWGMTQQVMSEVFNEVYNSGKRLDLHANYNPQEDQFYLYIEQKGGVAPVRINEMFIRSVTRQIEVAIDRGYAEFVFFPDMGHSHLYFLEDHWNKNYENDDLPLGIKAPRYEKMFADPEMYPLYHLAEQLLMKDEEDNVLEDPVLSFRYWNRNFVGKNDGSDYEKIYVETEMKFNTVKGIEGHEYYSAGFAVSASAQGCFPYRDKDGSVKYFDIGLKDPEPEPGAGGGYDWGL